MEETLRDPEGLLVHPAEPGGCGVLVLGGSSGRIDHGRARVLAAHGATAMAIRWFDGPGLQPEPYEVPLELFFGALDRLAPMCDRLAVVGLSFGAEAALLTSAHDRRVTATIGFAPSSVVWAGVDTSHQPTRQTSQWTLGGKPTAYVPFDERWEPDSDPPAYAECYRQSLRTYADCVPAATIPVERIAGSVVLVAGGDDQVWPSVQFAAACSDRRAEHGLPTTVITDRSAGHRVTLPGESEVVAGARMARGGTPEANAHLGRLAWPAIVAALDLHP
ncbi:acyl-CoA thioester hydrolase/BAAT C-terminal domain-containing protein [Leekyejoonella antrihumi]|uniref:Acyl-CoA thioesterase n=1 Tax=Leekyejoonella antrihumi TaxID=1660198 RepID=A0A563E1L0_9MICO|nr:acyl-CoA thioester hydrolase/BAAT C-terminal domain-containing protein [Leekyejoonella antrihumi]TWP36091.1 acyl-CoA thioesterase [Leekyejoonella antrihumi]